MPKIALCSDLHLEFDDINLKNTENADVLILSGDICVAHSLHDHPVDGANPPQDAMKPGRNQQAAVRYRDFFSRVNDEFPNTVLVTGNHEGYHGRYPDFYDWIREEMTRYPNIHFLEQDKVEIDGYTFVGGTLWTDMNKQDPTTEYMIESMMNDFRVIRNSQNNYRRFSATDAVRRHLDTVHYIKTVVDSDPDKKYVVVGHHAPSFLSVHEKYKHDRIMNGGYASDLSEVMLDRPQIKLWTLGHMHDPHSYYIGETFVVCNPRGYSGHDVEADNFKLRFIDLENMPEKFDGVKWSREN
jgi:Icc-related predicted phosphoesterase